MKRVISVLLVAVLAAFVGLAYAADWRTLKIKGSSDYRGIFYFDLEGNTNGLKDGICTAKVTVKIGDKTVALQDTAAVFTLPPVKERLPQISIAAETLMKQVNDPDLNNRKTLDAIKASGIIDVRQ